MFDSLERGMKEVQDSREKLGRVKCIHDIAHSLNQMRDNGVVLTYKVLGELLEKLNLEA